MRLLIIFLLAVVLLVSGCSTYVIPELSSGAEQVLKNLPDGWTGSVIEADQPYPCLSKEAFFTIEFEYPSVVCEMPTKDGGTENVSPSFRLHYYPKFEPQDWEEYVTCVAKLGLTAVATPFRFAETDEHTIMTTLGYSCPEKDNSEIENYLNEFYEVI